MKDMSEGRNIMIDIKQMLRMAATVPIAEYNGRKLYVGTWHHFKGKDYFVIGIAVHAETDETLVLYKDSLVSSKQYARPLEMFLSEVDQRNIRMPRRSTGLKGRTAEMSNRAQRRQRNKKRNPHKADIGIKTKLVREHAIDIAVNRHLQIFMWIVVVALNDELGLGQTRTRCVLNRIEDVRSEWDKMRKDVDLDYANEMS